MTIYVLQAGCIYEGGGVKAVFTKRYEAIEWAERLADKENEKIKEGNAMMRKDHEPGGRFADYPFDPMPYYVPVDSQHPVVVEFCTDGDYIAIFEMESDPEVEA